MKSVVTVIKLFPVELVMMLLISGVFGAGVHLTTPTEHFLVNSVVGCLLVGIIRGMYHAGVIRELDFYESDLCPPAFEDEAHDPPVDPWAIICDQMIAARQYPPERPEITAHTFWHLSGLVKALSELSEDVADAFPNKVPADREFLGASLNTARNTLLDLSQTLRMQYIRLHPLAVQFLRDADPDERKDHEPRWSGSGALNESQSAALLMDITEATYALVSLAVSAGVPADDAFEAKSTRIDQTRNEYGMLEINPVTGMPTKQHPTVNYAALIASDLHYRGLLV